MRIIPALVGAALARTGYRLQRSGWNRVNADMAVNTLIDVGCAFDTPEFRRLAPSAALLLLDPVREYEPHMRRAVERRGGSFEIVAVSSREGTAEISVDTADPEKSSLFRRTALTRRSGELQTRAVPMKTLDAVVAEHAAVPPFGLKIDTEGSELDVITGAREMLRRTSFVIMEASVQGRFEGSYSFLELLEEMNGLGFEIGNVLGYYADPSRLVRFLDLVFVPKGARSGDGIFCRAL